jgi:hypothetical protein
MAKAKKSKKSGTRRRRTKAKIGRTIRKHPAPIGATAGLGYALIKDLTTNGGKYGVSPIQHMKEMKTTGFVEGASRIIQTGAMNAMTSDVYMPALGGAAITIIGPKIPVVGKPANRLVRDLTKGKGRL